MSGHDHGLEPSALSGRARDVILLSMVPFVERGYMMVPLDPAHRAPRRGRYRARAVGSVGDGHDNALAETINGPHETDVIRRRGP